MDNTDEKKKTDTLKRIYLIEKQDNILQNCFSVCTQKNKPGTSLSGKNITCVENCNIKLLNVYSFMFDVIKDGGISRSRPQEIKRMAM